MQSGTVNLRYAIVLILVFASAAFAAPSIDFVGPTPNDAESIAYNNVTINVSVTENVTACLLDINYANITPPVLMTAYNADANTTANFTLYVLPAGQYEYNVNCTNMTGDSNQTANRTFIVLEGMGAFILPQTPDSFFFPGTEPEINISVNATSPGSNISFVTADFSNLSASACDGAPIFNLTNSSGLWIGSCNISAISIPAGTYPYGATVTAIAYDLLSRQAQNTTVVLLHNLGVPASNDPSNCTRFGSETTNFSTVPNFGAVNFVVDYEMNLTCTSSLIANPNFTDGATINLTSVNLSTKESADKLANLSSAINVTIGQPGTFSISRIYVNTTYFQELNTNAIITLFNLPFISQPIVRADNASRKGSISVTSWTPTNLSLITGDVFFTGTLRFSVSGFSGYNVSENVSPSISIASPANGNQTNLTSILVNVTVNGTGTEPSLIIITINSSPQQSFIYNATNGSVTDNTANCANTTADGEVLRCLRNSTALAIGSYSLTVLAYDFAFPEPGNNATASSVFEIAYNPDAYETDNDSSSAKWILTNRTLQLHNFHSTTDVDYVKFNATAGYTYDILANATATGFPDTEMAVYDVNGTWLYYSDDIVLTVNQNSEIWFKAPYNGTFYVAVDEWSGIAGGNYTLSVQKLGIMTATITNITRTAMKNGVSFNVTVNATCVGGPCGAVQAALDPILEGANKRQKDIIAAAESGPVNVIVTLKEPATKLKTRENIYATQSAVLSSIPDADSNFKVKNRYTIVNAFSGTATAEGIKALLKNPNVASVRLSRTYHTALDVSVPLIGAKSVWNITANGVNINGTGQTVCILDTGMNYTHPDFGSCTLDDIITNYNCSKVVSGYDFVNDDSDFMDSNDGHGGTAALGHGSHVAGIVGSIDSVYRGVAPGAKIAMVKVCDSNNTCSDTNIALGIDWCMNNSAAYNISAISISLGGADCAYGDCDGKPCDDDTLLLASYINAASAANITVSVASGNDYLGESYPAGISQPACVRSAISVGATDDLDAIEGFTNRDQNLDILAPGVGIIATNYAGTHTSKDGTSMATPHVSGAVALISQYFLYNYNRTINPQEMDVLLKTSGKTIWDNAGIVNISHPRLNVLAATIEKGVISTTVGARPFYTTSSNPSNSPCYNNMASGASCVTTWNVRSNGDEGIYRFFAIYGTNYSTYYSTAQNVTIDTTAPNVSLVSPANNNFSASANVTLTFNVTDNFDTNLTCPLYVDGVSKSTFAVQNGTSGNDYTTNYSNGLHVWYANCTDDASNTGTSGTRNFTVDTINPAISIVSPSQAYYPSGVNMLLNISATDTNKDTTWFYTNGTVNITYTVPVTLNFTDGIYNMTAWANDSAGRTNTTNRTFIVDTTAPTISFADPTPNSSTYVTKSYVAINASASDANLANITIRIYNSTGGLRNSSFSNSSASLFANFTGLSNGVYYFNATVYDKVGLYNFTETRNVTVDFTGPAISFVYPSDNTSSLSRDSIIANISAPGADLANLTIYLYDGAGLVNFTNSTSSPLFANFSGLGNGIYYVNATAFDNAGNLNKTETRTITLDTNAPSVALGAPANDSFTSSASVNTSFTAVDALAANTSCKLYTDGTIRANITAANNTLMSQTYNYTAGTHNWSVNCTDFANNTGASDGWNFTVDLANPTISVVSPLLGYYYSNGSILINISANDTNLDTVWFYTNGTNVTYTPPGVPFILGFDDGIYNMTAWVNDSAGRTVSSGFTFTVDTAAPTVAIQSPANDTYNTSNLNLSFTASDTYIEACWYSIDGGSATAISGCANGSAIVGLANGSQCVSVFVNDSAGNTANDTECLTLELAPELIPPVYSALQPSSANYNETYRPNLAYLLNATWTDDTGIGAVLVESNFSGGALALSPVTSLPGNQFEYDTSYLGAGAYIYRWIANDTFNNTNDSMPYRNITIIKADPNATLVISPSWNGTWPYGTTVNCTGAVQVNMTLYRNNNTLASSGFGSAQEIRNLSAGSYNYTCNTSGNENYTSDSASSTLTIGKLNSALSLNAPPSWTVNWSGMTNVSCNASSLLNISLSRNGSPIGTGMGHVEQYANLSAGSYNYSCSISANENHTANSTSRVLTVNKATPTLTLLLDGSASDADIDTGDTLHIIGNATKPTGGYIELYVDSVLFNRGNALLSNSTSWSSSGTHTVKVVFNATQNYSASSLSRTVTVSSSGGGGGGGGGGGAGLPYMKITNYTTCNNDNTSNVRVVVVSAANNTPLNLVTVFTDYNNIYTAYTTGYTFRSLADGTYTIHAEKNGYHDASLAVSLNCTPRTTVQQNQTGGGTTTQNQTTGGTTTQNKTAGGSVIVVYSSNGTNTSVNVTLVGIGSNYATYKVDNLTGTVRVNVGQNLSIDIDNDGKPDIYIKLNGVTSNSTSAIIDAIRAPLAGQGACIVDNDICATGEECCSKQCVNEVCTSGINIDGIINPIKSLAKEMADNLPQVLAALLIPLVLFAIAIVAGYFLFLRKGIEKKRK
jgi:hypothetical protein